MIRVNAQIALDEREIQEDFVRASGPGGQNVNKVSTAVQLRFDVARSPSLPDPVRARLIALAGRRLTQDGVLILLAERYRSQRRNRDDALERLIELIREACEVDKPRRPTRPTLASGKRRLDSKQRRGEIKKLRTAKPGTDS
ncbi:MAG: alternative ribosome rescue aminoacyl-tRNA hydrolase ArfB [Thiobacillus sp.]